MKRITLFIALLITFFSKAQDYVVEEKFTPKTYGNLFAEFNPNNRSIVSWGRSYDSNSDEFLIPKGSNYFDARYQYNQKLFLGCSFVSGFGYNWDALRLNNDSATLYNDSIFHDKRKLRFQNITTNLGLRFQTSSHPDEGFFFQATMYNDFLVHSASVTWDEIEDSELKTRLKGLDYVNKHSMGVELRLGYMAFAMFSRYSFKDIVKNSDGYQGIPRLTFGVQIEVAASE